MSVCVAKGAVEEAAAAAAAAEDDAEEEDIREEGEEGIAAVPRPPEEGPSLERINRCSTGTKGP